MGRLIIYDEFALKRGEIGSDTKWYFPEQQWYSPQGYPVPVVESGFPYAVYSHMRHFEHDHGNLRVQMRRFVERSLEGCVLCKSKNMTYRVRPKPKENEPYPNTYEIGHGYYGFHFEEEHDRIAFRLRFSEFLDEVQDHHPDHRHIPEDEIWQPSSWS